MLSLLNRSLEPRLSTALVAWPDPRPVLTIKNVSPVGRATRFSSPVPTATIIDLFECLSGWVVIDHQAWLPPTVSNRARLIPLVSKAISIWAMSESMSETRLSTRARMWLFLKRAAGFD